MKTKDQILLEEAYDNVNPIEITELIDKYVKSGCNRSLDFGGSDVKVLPKKVQSVGGDLGFFHCTELHSLPDNLTVEGNLDLRYCYKLKSLPDNLTVGGALLLQDCTGLTTLPKNLKVGDMLGMTNTKIELKEIKHFVDVKGEVHSYNFSNEEFEEHNYALWKYEELKKKLPELEGIF